MTEGCIIECGAAVRHFWIFGSGTDPISLLILSLSSSSLLLLLLLLLRLLSSKKYGSDVSKGIGMKFSRIVLQVNAHRFPMTNFRFDVTFSR